MLRELKCTPSRSGEPVLSEAQIREYHPQIPDWKVIEKDGINCLEREFKFKNFTAALTFTNRVGQIAEEEDHHPSILTEWGKVTVTWWTHTVHGLHRNDFIMAAKTDALYKA